MEDNYSCEHREIEDDICINCGYMFEENMIDYSDKIQLDDSYHLGKAVKKEEFNYFNRLAQLDIDKEICMHVCEQISELKEKSHVRVGTHIKNLFVMIYIAYNTKEIIFCPNQLGKKLGMTDKNIKEAVKIASTGIDKESGVSNPVCIFSPFNFIRKYSQMNVDEHVIPEKNYLKLEELIKLIISHDKMLSNENPEGIAVTILKMYYEWNNIPFAEFIKKSNRTCGYIKSKENNIIKILNKI